MDVASCCRRFGRLFLPGFNILHCFKIPIPASAEVRSITCSAILCKHNQRRPRALGSGAPKKEKASAGRSSAKELMATTNRSSWEKEKNRLTSLTGKSPSSHIYLESEFEPHKLLLGEVLQALQEAGHPDMYDCLDNPLHVKVALNMCTKKRTKFIQKFDFHIVLPHLLDFVPQNRVLALCQNSEETSTCLGNGALDAGTTDLFARLEHGNFHSEEYDTLVAHLSWEPALAKLRHVLKDRMPTRKNGRLGGDVPSLVTTYAKGTSVESTLFTGVPEISHVDLVLGQLTWDPDRLESNLRNYLETMELKRPSRVHGSFIISAQVHCPPITEKFSLNIQHYIHVNEINNNEASNERDDEKDPDVSNEELTILST